MVTHVAVAVLATVLAACGSAGDSGGGAARSTLATATSLQEVGGMDALVAAARQEGELNTIALPANWANYGNIIKAFQTKYGIKVNNANPDGSSQDEINAVKQLKGQDRAPDVLDLGQSFAISAAKAGLLAKYKVAGWAQIPDAARDPNGAWFSDYGGYVAIGYDPAKVKTPPTSFADLLKPDYRNQVAINGNPTQADAAFAAVYAAALASSGSFDNIQPGLDYFKKMREVGNFIPVTGSAATVQSGQTPILIWWDYLQESSVASQLPTWKVVIPSDAKYAAYYAQAINANAPHPAAARLWQEFLYSPEGQNLWLEGSARPILLPNLVQAGSVNQAAYAKLPPVPAGDVTYPTNAQQDKAKAVVSQGWTAATGS